MISIDAKTFRRMGTGREEAEVYQFSFCQNITHSLLSSSRLKKLTEEGAMGAKDRP